MHFKSLELVNFQMIEEFSADFEGNVYLLMGDNEKGKSTILKSIGSLMGITRDDVLKNGTDKGYAKAIIGNDNKEYEVELRYTKANPKGTLTVKTSDGMKTDSVTAIQKIFGYTDFDAVEFIQWSETAEGRRKQINAVKKLLPENIQKAIEYIDADVKNTRELRKEANAELKTLKTLSDEAKKGLTSEDVKKYAEPVKMEDLLKQQETLLKLQDKEKKANELISESEATVKGFEEKLEQLKNDRDKAIKEANERFELGNTLLSENLTEYKGRVEKAENWLKEFKEQNIDVNSGVKAMEEAQKHNDMNKKVQEYQKAKERLNTAAKKSEFHEYNLEKLLTERENLIKESSLPIEGLSFTEDGLELSGVPFEAGKVSDSQIMEVATKLIIASNPTTKLFRIARGESLGEKRLREIVQIAHDNGFQGFIEQVVRGKEELTIEEYTEL